MGRIGRVAGFVSDDARLAYLEAYDSTLALAPVRLDTIDIETAFGTTHVASAGQPDAPPLVVLHGKNCSSTMWLDLLPTLIVAHRAHLVDCSGDLGKSVATTMMLRPADVARWLDDVLDGLGIERPAFVGFSNGAFHSATYATERPERVERLALLAPAGVISRLPLSYWRSLFATMLGDRDAKWERFWGRHYVGTEPSPLRQRFDEQFLLGNKHMRFAVRDRLPKVLRPKRLARLTMPTLVVFAEHDICHDGPATAEKARRLLPTARVELLADSGHFVIFDTLPAVAALLADFLGADMTAPRGGRSVC